MALERNKTAFQFEPGIDPEFERMLRRHLKRGGSMVAACSGFDADLASAFLEHSLPEPARSQYHLHLAGCAACRRHLIELSRLFDSTEAIPALGAEKQPANPTLSWKEKLAGWLDVSRWQAPAWNLQTAGLATTAVLLVAVGGVAIRQYRQVSAPQQALPVNTDLATSMRGGPAEIQPAAEDRAVGGNQEANRAESLQQGQMAQLPADKSQQAPVIGAPVPVPTLRSTPPIKDLNNNLLIADQAASISMRSSSTLTLPILSPLAAPPALPLDKLAAQARPMVTGESAESSRKPEPERARAAQDVAAAPAASANMVVPQVGPSPDDNPMRGDKAADPEPAARKAAKLSSRRERIIAGALSFLPTRKDEAEAKPQPIKDNESLMRLKVRIHDRVFEYHSDKNMWIDQNYEAGMAWRVIRLVRGSEEYNQVLKEQPELKDFFVKDSILVIWKQKIYKVVPK